MFEWVEPVTEFVLDWGGHVLSLFMLIALPVVTFARETECQVIYTDCAGMFWCSVVIACEILYNFFILDDRADNTNNLVTWIKHYPKLMPADDDPFAGKKCPDCEGSVPWRSYHCHFCEFHVLRGEYHSRWLNSCIGVGNTRYYIVLMFWTLVGLGVAIPYNMQYLQWYFDQFPDPVFGPYVALPPLIIIRWFQGTQSNYHMITSVVTTIGFFGFFRVLYYFVIQLYCTLTGVTWHDLWDTTTNPKFKPKHKADGRNVWERLTIVFGKGWWINFICPLPYLPDIPLPTIEGFFSIPKKKSN